MTRRSLADEIKEALLARLTSGALRPGDRLIELKIAREMETSQAPVREALRDLEAIGVIEMRRNRGAVVRAMSAAELCELYAVRAALEGLAVEAAVARGADLCADLGARLTGLCDRIEAAVAAGDITAFVDLNTAFHRAIVDASGNSVLSETWARLDIRASTAANLSRPNRHLGGALEDHRRIAALVVSGQGGAARSALEAHVNAVVGNGA